MGASAPHTDWEALAPNSIYYLELEDRIGTVILKRLLMLIRTHIGYRVNGDEENEISVVIPLQTPLERNNNQKFQNK